MKSKLLKTSFVLIVMLIKPCTIAWTYDEKNEILSITPTFSFSWYPSSEFFKEESTNTDVDIMNYGFSFIMGLKLFNKIGAYLNLSIDDPNFKKLVDLAGYITAYNFMVKYNYHSFGGKVTWTGDTPNPISGDVYNFRNQWSNISLLYRIDHFNMLEMFDKVKENPIWMLLLIPFSAFYQCGLMGPGKLTAIGLGYANFDMPLEYKIKSKRELYNSGFGLIKGQIWGLSIYTDTLLWQMHSKIYEEDSDMMIPFLKYLWINVDWFTGISPFGPIGRGETDPKAIAWISNANNGVSVDGNINHSLQYSIFKGNLGLQFIREVGEKGKIGIAVGVEFLEETIEASSKDLNIYFWSRYIGPAMNVSIRW